MADLPWLLIDVDGVLNPELTGSQARRGGFFRRHGTASDGRRFPLWLSPHHAPMLLAMTDRFRLAWATTWMHDANTEIGPYIGLPALPVVEFDFTNSPSKVPGVLSFVGTEPFVWLDDALTPFDVRMLAERHTDHLVVIVDERLGLVPDDLTAARTWAERRCH